MSHLGPIFELTVADADFRTGQQSQDHLVPGEEWTLGVAEEAVESVPQARSARKFSKVDTDKPGAAHSNQLSPYHGNTSRYSGVWNLQQSHPSNGRKKASSKDDDYSNVWEDIDNLLEELKLAQRHGHR